MVEKSSPTSRPRRDCAKVEPWVIPPPDGGVVGVFNISGLERKPPGAGGKAAGAPCVKLLNWPPAWAAQASANKLFGITKFLGRAATTSAKAATGEFTVTVPLMPVSEEASITLVPSINTAPVAVSVIFPPLPSMALARISLFWMMMNTGSRLMFPPSVACPPNTELVILLSVS